MWTSGRWVRAVPAICSARRTPSSSWSSTTWVWSVVRISWFRRASSTCSTTNSSPSGRRRTTATAAATSRRYWRLTAWMISRRRSSTPCRTTSESRRPTDSRLTFYSFFTSCNDLLPVKLCFVVSNRNLARAAGTEVHRVLLHPDLFPQQST